MSFIEGQARNIGKPEQTPKLRTAASVNAEMTRLSKLWEIRRKFEVDNLNGVKSDKKLNEGKIYQKEATIINNILEVYNYPGNTEAKKRIQQITQTKLAIGIDKDIIEREKAKESTASVIEELDGTTSPKNKQLIETLKNINKKAEILDNRIIGAKLVNGYFDLSHQKPPIASPK
jgi:hypothetical protein